MKAWSGWWVTKPSSVSLINVVGSCNHMDQEADSRAQRTAETLNTISGAAHYLHVGLYLATRPKKRSTTRRWHIPELICGIWRRAGLVVFGLLSRGQDCELSQDVLWHNSRACGQPRPQSETHGDLRPPLVSIWAGFQLLQGTYLKVPLMGAETELERHLPSAKDAIFSRLVSLRMCNDTIRLLAHTCTRRASASANML